MAFRSVSRLLLVPAVFSGLLFAQTPTITAVTNAALPSGKLAPGTLVDVAGSQLGTDPTVGATVGGKKAQVFSATNAAWRILIPLSVPAGQANVEIGNSAPFSVTLQAYAPTLFSVDGSGTGIVNAQGYPGGNTSMTGYVLSNNNTAKLGDALVLNTTGLGPIDPNESNATLELPTATLGGKPLLVVFANMVTDVADCWGSFCKAGMYQVMVSLPPAMPTGDLPLTLSIGGSTTQTLTVPVNKTPVVNAVVNAASNKPNAPLAPGSLASIYGTTFGLKDQACDLPAINDCTNLSGVSVTFNGTPAPLLYLGTSLQNDAYGQINLQVPAEMPESGAVTVKVTTPDGTGADYTVQMAAAAPGAFILNSNQIPSRKNGAVLVTGKSWLVMPDALATEYGIPGNCRAGNVPAASFCAEPAKPGDAIQILVTGLGKASPNGEPSQGTLGTGQLTPADGNPLYKTLQQPTVTIGGVPAVVDRAVVVPGWYAGFYRIDLTVPANAPVGDDVPVTISMPNGQSDANMTIAIR